MSKSDYLENQLLKLIFNGTAIPNLADNAGVSPLANLYVALHTADPSESGAQDTSEISYTGYARQAVSRDAAGWNVSANVVTPVNRIDFPTMAGGAGGLVTHWSIGTDLAGAGNLLYVGTLTPSVDVFGGVIAQIQNTSTVSED